MTIHYLTGDATQPIKTPALIMHCCNDQGGWGRGFVLALSKRWPHVEQAYRSMKDRPLGAVQYVLADVDANIDVANIIGQHGMYPALDGTPPVRYKALSTAFAKIASDLNRSRVPQTIHAPRLGCGLAGGEWPRVAALLDQHFPTRDVYIYDLP